MDRANHELSESNKQMLEMIEAMELISKSSEQIGRITKHN